MKKTFDEIISEIATPQKIDPGGRFSIEDPNVIWYVGAGAFDVFFVKKDRNNDVKEPLYQFHRVKKGELFFFSPFSSASEFSLIGRICSYTTIIKIPKELFHHMDAKYQKNISEKIDRFLTEITKKNVKIKLPSNVLDVQNLNEVHLNRDDNITSKKSLKWLRKNDEDEVYFINDRGLSSKGDINYFPLTPYPWFEITKDFHSKVYKTEDLIKEKGLWKILDDYMAKIIELNFTHIANKDLYQGSILYSKINNNLYAIHESVDLLRKSATIETLDKIFFNQKEDPIYFPCYQVASQQDLKLINPNKIRSNYDLKNRFKHYMTFSKIFFREVYLEEGWYQKNHGPLLVFYETSKTPLAVIPVQGEGYVYFDKKQGRYNKVTQEKANQFSLSAYFLYRKFEEKNPNIVKFIKKVITKDSFEWMLMFFCFVSIALLGLATPLVTEYIFDNIIITNNVSELLQIILILFGISMATIGFELTKYCLLLNIESRIDLAVQGAFWDRVFRLPINFFKKYASGELVSIICNLNLIRLLISGMTSSILLDSLFVFTNLALIFYYQAVVASVLCFMMVFIFFIIIFLEKKRLYYEDLIVSKNAKIFGLLSEFFSAISKIRSAGAEYRIFSIWAKKFFGLQKLTLHAQRYAIFSRITTRIFPLITIGIMYVGIGLLFDKDPSFSIGRFLAFNIALGQVSLVFYQLMSELNRILIIKPYYDKTKIFLDVLPEVKKGLLDPGELNGEIELSHLSFKYKGSSNLILRDINISIQSGECIAFVGRSGEGKSTLIRLMLGFDDPLSGRVYYDSKDLSLLDLSLLRQKIGVVLQHDSLGSGSIFSNISGTSNLTIEEAWELAEKVGMSDDILNMPMQMNTIINLDGEGLSGGQKQRLMIARAIARKPKILMLDEAT